MKISIGIGVEFTRVLGSIDSQASAHYDRVIADGGTIPSGLIGCNSFFVAVKAVYNTTDITTAISAGYDPHYLGYRAGDGVGTTSGQAAQKLYSCSGASGDLIQTTAASQPLLLVKNASDSNYYFQSGSNLNYCSTPNAPANQITGDIEIIVKAAPINWATEYGMFVAKNSGGTNGWCFFTRSSKRLGYVSTRGEVVSTIGHSFVNNEFGWVKVTHDTTNGIVKFYTSTDGIAYTQLGANVSTTAGTTTNQSINVEIGTNAGGGNQIGGKIERATISNSIGGSPVVDFNPNQYNAATSQTQWTSATGEVWTINTGTASTGYKGVLVDRTIVQGDGVDDTMNTAVLTSIAQPYTNYHAYNLHNSASANFRYAFNTNVRADHNSPTMLLRGNAGVAYNSAYAKIVNRLQLISTNLNGADTKIRVDNNAEDTINAGTNPTGNNSLYILSSSAPSDFCNSSLTTFIITKTGDNSTTSSEMYNALRSFNNNAF